MPIKKPAKMYDDSEGVEAFVKVNKKAKESNKKIVETINEDYEEIQKLRKEIKKLAKQAGMTEEEYREMVANEFVSKHGKIGGKKKKTKKEESSSSESSSSESEDEKPKKKVTKKKSGKGIENEILDYLKQF